MNIRLPLAALIAATLAACAPVGIKQLAASPEVFQLCGEAPASQQPQVNLAMGRNGDWMTASIRCGKSSVKMSEGEIVFNPVTTVPAQKPLAVLIMEHDAGPNQDFPINLAAVLAKLEGGNTVKYLRGDPLKLGAHFTGYVY